MSFVSATPFQAAVAHALVYERDWQKAMVEELAECRDILVDGLREAGYQVHETQGTYYLVADVSSSGMDGVEFCTKLPRHTGLLPSRLLPLPITPNHGATKSVSRSVSALR